ncbi:uncharacterized protein DS421_17g577360 [Arachis hypogaea]|nr:uncharacterized protein DS421_17g577360 [Arachis hypogaea]
MTSCKFTSNGMTDSISDKNKLEKGQHAVRCDTVMEAGDKRQQRERKRKKKGTRVEKDEV